MIKTLLPLQLEMKYEANPRLKKIAKYLECEIDSGDLNNRLKSETEDFDEYFSYFNSLVKADVPFQVGRKNYETFFKEPARLLKAHKVIREHIVASGFLSLANALGINSEKDIPEK